MKTIRVNIAAANGDYSLVHDLRNVGEDVYRAFYFEGIVEVPDMDFAISDLHIHVKATRHLGEVTTVLKKSLKKRGLFEQAVITRKDHA